MKQGVERLQHRTLALALLVSLVLWNLPFGGVLLYPFKIFGTWLHELSHALVMLITGTGVDRVLIYGDGSGLAYPASGAGPFAAAVIAAAGYMGTPLWGAALFVATPTGLAARRAMLILAALLAITAVLVMGNPFGQGAVAGLAVAFVVLALVLPERWRVIVAHFVAAQACVDAVLDIRVLFRPAQVVDGIAARASDAHSMANVTFGTTDDWAVRLWVVIWLVWSLAVLYAALRYSDRRAARRAAAVVA